MGTLFGQTFQRIEIPSSFNPVGSGARALGMGGAFIAVADDATAASWNPAGLIQLETPEVSIVGAYFRRTEENDFGNSPEASGEETASETSVNYLSVSYPFAVLHRNMIVSLSYQNLFDFTRQWKFPLTRSASELAVRQDIDYEQEGSLSAIGLAYGIQITPRLSFGLTLNFWENGIYANKWRQTIVQKGRGTLSGNPLLFEIRSKDTFSFSGFNINLGVLWQVTGRLTLGAVIKTPFEADLRHKSSFTTSLSFPEYPPADTFNRSSSVENNNLEMPTTYGIGFAYRFSDSFTASLDVSRTDWDDFVLEDNHGNRLSPISGLPRRKSDVEPTYQVRLGGEYLFIGSEYVIPIRGGLFYDPAPAEGDPDDFFGFSLGSGISFGRFIIDVAYQYRYGKNVSEYILKNLDFSQDVIEHTVYTSLIVHFW